MSQCSVGMGWSETECWLKRNEERLGVCLCLFERRGEISNFGVLLKCEDRKLILLHLVKFSLKEISPKAVLLQGYCDFFFHLNSAVET